MRDEIQTRIAELEGATKNLTDRLHGGQTPTDTFWAVVSVLGLIGLLGGLLSVLQTGINPISGATILVGGALTFRWHRQTKDEQRGNEVLKELSAELKSERKKLAAFDLRNPTQ